MEIADDVRRNGCHEHLAWRYVEQGKRHIRNSSAQWQSTQLQTNENILENTVQDADPDALAEEAMEKGCRGVDTAGLTLPFAGEYNGNG